MLLFRNIHTSLRGPFFVDKAAGARQVWVLVPLVVALTHFQIVVNLSVGAHGRIRTCIKSPPGVVSYQLEDVCVKIGDTGWTRTNIQPLQGRHYHYATVSIEKIDNSIRHMGRLGIR